MNKKIIKYAIISIVAILFIVFLILIYKNVFASTNSNRFSGIENYKLTNDEKNSVESIFKENEKIKSVKVYVNNKIINIMLNLSEDVEFDEIKTLANNSISNFSEENLTFYDIQIYVNSSNADSEIYPKIGYKFKGNNEFAW